MTSSTDFYNQKLWGFILPALEPGMHGLAWRWNGLLPRYPPSFHLPQVNVGLPVLPAAATTALLPLPHCVLQTPAPCNHLDEYCLFKSWLWDFHTVKFFWQFWLYFILRLVVILLMAVQEGEVCLPTPPSWKWVPCSDNFWYFLDYQALSLHLNYLISHQTNKKHSEVCIFIIHIKNVTQKGVSYVSCLNHTCICEQCSLSWFP